MTGRVLWIFIYKREGRTAAIGLNAAKTSLKSIKNEDTPQEDGGQASVGGVEGL